MSVKMFTKYPGAVMPVAPDLDINKVLQSFDHPEMLDVIESGPLSGAFKVICLKSEKQRIIADAKEKMQRLKRMGITEEIIDNMSGEDLLKLKELL